MKTLVIHPKDRSTEFLSVIYKDILDMTLLQGDYPATMNMNELNELIKSHDRVIMLGHGCPAGLFSLGRWKKSFGLVINKDTAKHLKEKTDNIYIWCNADRYVNMFGLKGFYSGMFISETGEAWACGVRDQSQKRVDESNNGFCEILSKYVNENSKVIHENVVKEYGELALENQVAKYNNERIYLAE